MKTKEGKYIISCVQNRIEERYMPINGFYNKYKDYLV